jgi:glucose/arabinose dehydrogenase
MRITAFSINAVRHSACASLLSATARTAAVALACLFPLCASPLHAQFNPDNPIPAVIPHGPARIDLRPVVTGLVSPVLLIAAPDGSKRLFIVEQKGQIVIVKNGARKPEPFLDLSSRMVTLNPNYDERGLLGLAFDPGFADPGSAGYRRIFTYSSEPTNGPADFPDPYSTALNHQGVVASWRVSAADPDVVDPASRVEILRVDEPQSNHNGGTITFGPDGNLYIGLGDGGGANDNNANGHNPTIGNGQDLTIALGKLLRIDVNGTNSTNGKYGIPPTNPFAESGGLREIYASGFRNPYRFSFDGTDLWVADVGQNKVEELDRVEVGKNYGWRYKEGRFKFNTDGTISDDLTGLPDGLVDPVLEYDHDEGASITGGFVYRGSAIPELVGKYVFGDFSRGFSAPGGRLFYADLVTREIREFILGNNDQALGLYVKGFGLDADGEIYVLGTTVLGPQGTSGIVLKIVPPALYTKGAAIPGAGVENSGVPVDAKFKSCGVPSINDASEMAFGAGYTSGEGNRAVVLGPKGDDRTTFAVLAKSGEVAPGIDGQALADGAVFSSFNDPVLAETGRIGVIGKLRNSRAVPASKDTGIWTNADSGILHLIAREGEAAPGADGAKFKSFTSIALGEVDSDSSVLVFTAQLSHSGGVNNSNDTGLWRSLGGEVPTMVLREKQSIAIGNGSRTVKSFKALAPVKAAAGQGNGTAQGLVAVQVSFTDGTQAVGQIEGAGEFNVIAVTGDTALDGAFGTFSSLTQSMLARTAFLSSFQDEKKHFGVFAQILPPGLQALAETGDPAPGTDAFFANFEAVVHGDAAGTAFMGTITGGTTKGGDNTGIWWEKGDALALIAREGGEAADVTGGKWASFKSLALPSSGPLFLADLALGAGVTAANRTGLWAVDSQSNVHLVLRSGQTIAVGGEDKKLRAFTILSVVPGSPTQTRSFNSSKHLIYRAHFTDGSQSVQTLTLP